MTDRASAEGLRERVAAHRVDKPINSEGAFWNAGIDAALAAIDEFAALRDTGPRPGPIATLSLYEQGRRQTLMDLGFDIDGIDTATAVEAARDTGPRPDSGIDDWTRVAEAWANVMDGRRIGSGLNAAHIGRDTTTGDDWHAIAREYAALASERTEP